MKEGKIMKRQIRAFITVILICMMMSGSALAQPIHFTRVIPAISATAMDGQKKLVESDVIQLLGCDEAGNGIIFVNGEYGQRCQGHAAAADQTGISGRNS